MKTSEILFFLEENNDVWASNTPCFVVDHKSLRNTLHKFKNCFSGEIAYSYKTNPDSGIVQILAESGASFLLSSIYELQHCVNYGIADPSRFIFHSPSLSHKELETVLAIGVTRLIVGSREQLRLILDAPTASNLELYVRVNTGVSVHDAELPYSSDSYLGFPIEEATGVLRELQGERQSRKLRFGIHNHLLSQNTHLDLWEENAKRIGDFAESLKSEGIEIDSINWGGGYPVEYKGPVLTLESIGKVIQVAMARIRTQYPQVQCIYEPGRKLVAESITLVSKVVRTKTFRGQRVAILDASLYNASLDTLIIGLHLPAHKLESGAKTKYMYVIRGSTPDSLDVFLDNAEFEELREGDMIAFLHAGAYSAGSDFISLPKPPHIIV